MLIINEKNPWLYERIIYNGIITRDVTGEVTLSDGSVVYASCKVTFGVIDGVYDRWGFNISDVEVFESSPKIDYKPKQITSKAIIHEVLKRIGFDFVVDEIERELHESEIKNGLVKSPQLEEIDGYIVIYNSIFVMKNGEYDGKTYLIADLNIYQQDGDNITLVDDEQLQKDIYKTLGG